MSGTLFLPPRAISIDGNGDPRPGAKMYLYLAGTSTAVTAYTDAALTTPHASPIVASSAGVWPPIYLSPGVTSVKVVTQNSDGTQISSDDAVSITQGGRYYGIHVTETSLGITPADYTYPPGHVRRYGAALNGSADDYAELQQCADFCAASGVPIQGDAGTAVISATLSLNCAGDLSMMTISCPSTTVSRTCTSVKLTSISAMSPADTCWSASRSRTARMAASRDASSMTGGNVRSFSATRSRATGSVAMSPTYSLRESLQDVKPQRWARRETWVASMTRTAGTVTISG